MRELAASYPHEVIYGAAAFVATGEPERSGWVRTTLRIAAQARGRKLKRGPTWKLKPDPKPRGRPRRDLNRTEVIEAMQLANGKQRATARQLGIPLSTHQDYLRREPVPGQAWAYGPGLRLEHTLLLRVVACLPRSHGLVPTSRPREVWTFPFGMRAAASSGCRLASTTRPLYVAESPARPTPPSRSGSRRWQSRERA